MTPQVRGAALITYPQVARFVGLDPQRMLRRAGIDPKSFADPDARIPGGPVARLLEDSARESGCMAFGLLIAESRRLSHLGAVSLLVRHAGTARDAIEALIAFQAHFTEAFAYSLEIVGDVAILHTSVTGELAQRQLVEGAMAITSRAIGEVTDGGWHPECVHFIHAAPEDVTIHRRVFRCRLAFCEEFYGFSFPAALLDAPNAAAEAALARHARRYLELLVPPPSDQSAGEEARRALYLLLPVGRGTLMQTAANLGLHPKSLQRQLGKEGRSFAGLLNEVRRELALSYLSDPARSITAVGEMIGYASPSSFTRWFSGELGMSPARWRAERQQAKTGRSGGDPPAAAASAA